MEESIFPWVASTTRSKHAWDTLQNSYQGTRKVKLVRLQMLRRDFENFQMSNLETINDFFTHALSIVNQIKSHGDSLDDQKVVENNLSISIIFDPIGVAIVTHGKIKFSIACCIKNNALASFLLFSLRRSFCACDKSLYVA